MHPNEKITPFQSLSINGRSFYWASIFLSPYDRKKAARLYAFCRILDDLADGDIPGGEARLTQLQSELQSSNEDYDFASSGFEFFPHDVSSLRPVLSALLDGLVQDAGGIIRLNSERDLLRYAYCVAGTVGLLMCETLNCHNPLAKSHAIDLGIGMQLTNIARDVLEDARMGRRYIPGEWVSDLSPEEICIAAKKVNSPENLLVKKAVMQLLTLADKYYQSGAIGYRYLPWRARISIAVAAEVYREIGMQLAQSGYSWHMGRQVTSKASKLRCSFKAIMNLIFCRRRMDSETHDYTLHIALKGLPNIK